MGEISEQAEYWQGTRTIAEACFIGFLDTEVLKGCQMDHFDILIGEV